MLAKLLKRLGIAWQVAGMQAEIDRLTMRAPHGLFAALHAQESARGAELWVNEVTGEHQYAVSRPAGRWLEDTGLNCVRGDKAA